jgi:DNA polymerase-3 subunit delta'
MSEALQELAPNVDQKSRTLLAALADGAPGRALEFAEADAIAMYREIAELLQGLPRLSGAKLFGFAEKVARAPAERGVPLFVTLLSELEERLVRGAYAALPPVPGEEPVMRQLRAVMPLERWSALWEGLKTEALRADDLNLDKKQLVLNAFFAIEAASHR